MTQVLAGRPKDLEHVRGVLLERLDTLDLAMIRGTLGLLEDALSQSESAAFDAARGLGRSPDSGS